VVVVLDDRVVVGDDHVLAAHHRIDGGSRRQLDVPDRPSHHLKW